MAILYEEIIGRDDTARISEWVDSCAGGKTGYEEECHAWEVRRLFVLFDHLGDAGIRRFHLAGSFFASGQGSRIGMNCPKPCVAFDPTPEENRKNSRRL
jgi:hypothetical protein